MRSTRGSASSSGRHIAAAAGEVAADEARRRRRRRRGACGTSVGVGRRPACRRLSASSGASCRSLPIRCRSSCGNRTRSPARHVEHLAAVDEPHLARAFGEEVEEHHVLGAGEALADARQAVLAAHAPRRGELGVRGTRRLRGAPTSERPTAHPWGFGQEPRSLGKHAPRSIGARRSSPRICESANVPRGNQSGPTMQTPRHRCTHAHRTYQGSCFCGAVAVQPSPASRPRWATATASRAAAGRPGRSTPSRCGSPMR